MSEKRERDWGKDIAHIGNRQIDLEKKVRAEIEQLKKEMGQMFEYFESGRLREKAVSETGLPMVEPDTIPYWYRSAKERWRAEHEAWKKSVIPHLENLVYAGEDEHGIPILADFEVQLSLPVVYLLTAGKQPDRYAWMRGNPYEEWKGKLLKREGRDEDKA